MSNVSINIPFGHEETMDDKDFSSGGVDNKETGKDNVTLASAEAATNEVRHNS